MAGSLINTWNLHALPDGFSSWEEVWMAESERLANETRLENYLADSGSGLIIRRHSTGKDSRKERIEARQRHLSDMERLAVGSPAYMATYNNKLTLQIGGDDVEITQGQLHDLAKRRAEDLQRQIDAARRNGASADDIARMQNDLRAYRVIRDNSDPARGDVTPDGQRAIDDAIASSTDAQTRIRREGAILAGPQAERGEVAARFDARQGDMSTLNGWDAGQRASFAATIDEPSPISGHSALSSEFASAIARETLEPVAPDTEQPAPVSPGHGTGISL